MAFKIADGYVEVHGRVDEGSFKRAAKDAVDGFGDSGDKAGAAFVKAFGRAAGRAGGGGSGKAGLWTQIRRMFTPDPGLLKNLMHPLERSVSVPIVAAIAAGIVGLGSGAIAAAISSAVLLGIGGIVIGGAAALLADKLKPTFQRAMGTVGKALSRSATPLLEPLKQALRDFALFSLKSEKQFRRIFTAAGPIVPLLVDSFEAFAKSILPTIEQIMPSIVEMFEVLAARSPEIADAISELFEQMAQPETIEAFSLLLTGLIETIHFVADAIGFLTRSFIQDVRDIERISKNVGNWIEDMKGHIDSIPAKKTTKYLFQPGAALSWIGRVTGATKGIPRAWRTLMRFIGGGGAVGWALRVTGVTKRIPKSWATFYKFLFGGALSQMARVRSAIARIPRNVTTTLTSITRNITESITRFANPFARASGGIIGAQGMATGGISGSRSVLVGEQGPEMVNLPFGSRVTPAGQTRAELGQGGQGGRVVLEVHSGGSRLDDVLVELLRKSIRARAGGRADSVQVVLGN